MSKTTKKTFTTEEKEKIIKEAIESGNQSAVARKYGLSPSLIYAWVRRYKNKDKRAAKKAHKEYQQKIEDLELEVEVLKALLKKTTQTLIKD